MKTEGLWTPEIQKLHINALKIKAVMFAVKSFTKDMSQVNVHLRVDNTTTMSYINKMGGTKSMDMINISKSLWDYCLSKQITLTAKFLPGIQNQIADAQSRNYPIRAIGNNQNHGSSGDRSVRGPNQCLGAQVHQLETRSGVLGNRCFHGLVVWRCSICFPAILSNRLMPGQDQTGSSISHHDHNYVANPTVVPRNYVNVVFRPNTAASGSQSDHII